jgi:hypothetical protein
LGGGLGASEAIGNGGVIPCGMGEPSRVGCALGNSVVAG